MKKLLSTLALLLLSLQVLAQAGGIYVAPGDPNLFVTVHQNGNTLIVVQYAPLMYGSIDIGDGQIASPAAVYSLTYLVGQLSTDGKSSTAIGSAAAGACSASYALQFSETDLRMTLQGIHQTYAGSQQGIDCAALSTKLLEDQQKAGGAPLLSRIF